MKQFTLALVVIFAAGCATVDPFSRMRLGPVERIGYLLSADADGLWVFDSSAREHVCLRAGPSIDQRLHRYDLGALYAFQIEGGLVVDVDRRSGRDMPAEGHNPCSTGPPVRHHAAAQALDLDGASGVLGLLGQLQNLAEDLRPVLLCLLEPERQVPCSPVPRLSPEEFDAVCQILVELNRTLTAPDGTVHDPDPMGAWIRLGCRR